jgi:HD-like signal output (HDOD) protein
MPTLTLEDIVNKVDSLPPMPQALLKLTQMLEQEDLSAEDFAEVIKLDVELTAQLLRLCNSAYYGLNRKISTPKDAVSILGLKAIKSLVYTILSHRVLERPIEGYALEPGALWLNGLTGAVYARALARKYNHPEPETAFTAAILRDVGKLVIEGFVGEAYSQLEELACYKRIDFNQAEHEYLGFSHTDVGYELAVKWTLSEVLTSVIRYHHSPQLSNENAPKQEKQTLALVHLADNFALMLGNGLGSDGLMYGIQPWALEQLGLTLTPDFVETTLSELCDLQSQIQQLRDSLVA